MACGIDATSDGVSVDFNEIVGFTVGMRFGAVAQDGSRQIDFKRINDFQNEQPKTSVEESGDQSGQW